MHVAESPRFSITGANGVLRFSKVNLFSDTSRWLALVLMLSPLWIHERDDGIGSLFIDCHEEHVS